MRRRLAIASSVVMAAALMMGTAFAQIRGVPGSVTSLGPNGEIRGVPAGVTSLGPMGFHGRSGVPFNGRFGFGVRLGNGHRHFGNPVFLGQRGRRGFFPSSPFFSPFYSAFPGYSVVMPVVPEDYADYENGYPEEAEVPAPTIFEHRATRRVEPQPEPEPIASPQRAQAAKPADVPDQPATVLVFRDGHQLEVRNYAIVGKELINLSGAPRKIALADLDVAATTKMNDDNGIEFRLP